MWHLKNAETGEVLDSQTSYEDILDSSGFYGSLTLEVWHDDELIEEL